MENKKYTAVVSTSANPFHYGHLDIYTKAVRIFGDGNVCVLIAKNSDKKSSTNLETHMMVYNKKFGVEFEFLDNGKTVADWCLEHGVEFIVRGIRNGVDAEYELKLDFANRTINDKLQSVFIPTSDDFSNISSSTIREFLRYGKKSIAIKFMDSDALDRYLEKDNAINVYFGKSCSGKSTYLAKNGIRTIDCDAYIWRVLTHLKGSTYSDEIRERSRSLFIEYSRSRITKLKISEEYDKIAKAEFTDEFWKCFCNVPYGIGLDWAAVGNYVQYMPKCFFNKLRFVKFESPDFDTRKLYAAKRGYGCDGYFLDTIDSLYSEPPYIDEVIKQPLE